MVNFEASEKPPASRVQWDNVDLEDGVRPHPALHRSGSNISIHSSHSRRGSIDPASALPIGFRTVSFQINESQEKDIAELKKVKNTAAKGQLI